MKNYEATQELGGEELVAEHTGRMSVWQAVDFRFPLSARESVCGQLGLPGADPTGEIGACVLVKLAVEAGVRAVVFPYRLNERIAQEWRQAVFSLIPTGMSFEDMDAVLAPWVAHVAELTIVTQ
jgi:hypothetical protein